MNVPVNFCSYEGVGHQTTEEMLSDAAEFIKQDCQSGIESKIGNTCSLHT